MYNKIIWADKYIQLLNEDQGLWKLGTSYSEFIRDGATSVRRPKICKLNLYKNTGTASDSANRKKAKADSTYVETALDIYCVPFANEAAAQFESNDVLRQKFLEQAAIRTARQFNIDFITAGLKTTNALTTAAAGVFAWNDIASIIKKMNELEIPQDNRIIIIPADMTSDFLTMDVIKLAVSYNTVQLQTGKFGSVLGTSFFVTALTPTIAGKKPILGAYAPGIASIVGKTGQIEEVWDPENLWKVVDVLAHGAFDLDDNDFAVKMTLKS